MSNIFPKEKPLVYPEYSQQCRREDHDRLNFVERVVYDQKKVNDAQEAGIDILEARITELENLLSRALYALKIDPATLPEVPVIEIPIETMEAAPAVVMPPQDPAAAAEVVPAEATSEAPSGD